MIPDEDDIRGLIIENIVKYVKKRRGQMGVDRLFDYVGSHYGKKITQKDIVQHNWYPHRLFRTFVEGAAEVMGKDAGTLATEMGMFSSQNIGFLKFFLKFTKSPEDIITTAMDTWHQYHKMGRIEVVKIENGRCVVRVYDYFGGPYFCNGLASNMEGFLSYTAKNVHAEEVKCVSRGDDYCEYLITWEA